MNYGILDEAPAWQRMLKKAFIKCEESAYLDYLNRQKTGGVIP